jgi:hypothetical protein
MTGNVGSLEPNIEFGEEKRPKSHLVLMRKVLEISM